ncbi:tetratricopeptide repeat protein [Azospirillum sp. ST 5-10]|uniref:tetratricopeptide repeat protein n=1 Tax=unclassified Azospirillum TaxID=2630922 RepID=UPI003F49D4EB
MTTVGEALLHAFDLHQAGRFAEADALYASVLEAAPGFPDALHLRGLLAAQTGRLEVARARMERAIAGNPGIPDFHANLAGVLRALGHAEAAAAPLARAAALQPESAGRRGALARHLESLGRPDEALEHAAAAAALDPAAVAELNNFALRRRGDGDLGRAAAALRRAAALAPLAPEVRINLAAALDAAGRKAEAAAAFGAALCLVPDDPVTALELGRTRHAAGDGAGAERALAAARRLAPSAAAWNLTGCVLKDRAALEAAAAAFRHALALDPALVDALNNLGNVRKGQGRLAAAAALQRRAAAAAPLAPEALSNLADTLLRSGDPAGAEAAAAAALARAPDHAEAALTRAMALLAQGRLAEGWEAWDARWRADARLAGRRRRFPQPLWHGEPLGGRRLLVWGEQGVGDEVLFAALVPLLTAGGWRCALECDARLVPLFARSFPTVEVVARGEEPDARLRAPDIAAQVPAGDLPRRLLPDAAAFARLRPSLTADPGRVAALRAGRDPRRRHVGIAWHTTNAKFARDRNVPLERLAGALAGTGVRLVSLQYGDWDEPLAALARAGIATVAAPGVDPWHDLDGLAAVIAGLDLVVSVDNVTVHLAGALGTPTWALLPHAADWRWFRDRADSPWYPSLRLFRQPAPGDWETPLRRVGAALAAGVGRGMHDVQAQGSAKGRQITELRIPGQKTREGG